MNYIAHLHLADQTDTSLLGNFLGDFVKGDSLNLLPAELKTGVQLHRKIDLFTDSHHEILTLKKGFPSGIRKVSGIALDIYFDFLLMAHWDKYSVKKHLDVFDAFYIEMAKHELKLNERYSLVSQGLLQHKWLINYRDESHCLAALFSIEKRFNGKLVFAQSSHQYLQQNKQQIEDAFLRFYPQLLDYAKAIAQQLEN